MPAPLSTPDQRTTILAAALDLLRTEGPAGITVRKVADAAGYSTTGVYTWFGGKQGLVDAIHLGGYDSFDTALAAVPGTPGVDWLVNRGLEYRRWARDHPTEYLLMFARIVPGYEPSDTALIRGLESFGSHVESVRLALESGELDTRHSDPEIAAYHLWATVHGYVMLELTNMGADVCIDGPDHYEANIRTLLAGPSPA